MKMKPIFILLFFVTFSVAAQSQTASDDSLYIRQNYTKIERYITMRDGVKLFTAIYTPTDKSEKYPFVMERTPYACDPYGENNYATRRLGPSKKMMQEKYIFVYQDVRGRYMSEGDFVEVTPHKATKTSKQDIDESSDTYDTIEWLLKNIANNNGNVGMYGISYPGFYATAALPQSHPALKAVSPQAPVTDEFEGDDAYHRGAFFLLDNFSFSNYFDAPRKGLVQDYEPLFEYNEKDAYSFFLKLKTLKNINAKYFPNGKIWKEYQNHVTYDSYWKTRNIRPHLKNTKPAVLVVGGWFDAEDLFGTLATYQAIEKQNADNNNRLVMGPWTHGAWASPTWQSYATHSFGSNLNQYYQEEIEAKFFSEYLKNKDKCTLAEATVFDAGTNQWNSYDQWPPKNASTQRFYFQANGGLAPQMPSENKGMDTYVADPNHPVPYIDGYQGHRRNDYMVADQRFASSRPDVLTYQTDVLEEDLKLTGNVVANLFVSTTGTDADFVVKIIDVLPDTMPNPKPNPKGIQMAGFQRLVRAEVLRGKFRERFDVPIPFKPNKITPIRLQLNDVAHTIRKGHRLMIQVQSSWFPLVDLNPQVFMDIPKATEKDFHTATNTVYRAGKNGSFVEFQRIK